MAWATTETGVQVLSGFTPNLVLIEGTYASSGGATGGIISPGYTAADAVLTAISPATGSIGARDIIACWTQPATEDVTTTKAVTAYNSTTDADQVTLTTAANGTGAYFILGLNNGA